MTDEPEITPERIATIVERIMPMFAGEHPLIVGGALADLLALWLAGQIDPRGAKATRAHREAILKLHVDTVRALIKPNEEILLRQLRELERGHDA